MRIPQRKRLEKLAPWRIDPSLIEFPADAREFRGGFATVSQGLLAPSSRGGEDANESKHLTNEHHSLDDVNSQPNKDLQQLEPQTEEKNEDVDSRKAFGEKDRPEEEGTKEPNDEEEHASPRQPPVPDIGNEGSMSHHIVNEDLDLGDRDHKSHGNTDRVENDQQGESERSATHDGTSSAIVGGSKDEAKEEAGKGPKNDNEEQNCDLQTSKQVGDGSASELYGQ
ncbi:hypothetical protein FS837_012368 [Tulasnella sp. UAMH 9824]|nr:hypothetical protein FS837_012368 [Tulasnella sp. UAMH 9824]